MPVSEECSIFTADMVSLALAHATRMSYAGKNQTIKTVDDKDSNSFGRVLVRESRPSDDVVARMYVGSVIDGGFSAVGCISVSGSALTLIMEE
jgi:hypothetical protein